MANFTTRKSPATGKTAARGEKEYTTIYSKKNVPFFSNHAETMMSLSMIRNVEVGSKYNNDTNSLNIRLSLKAEDGKSLYKDAEGKVVSKIFNINNYDANLITSMLSFMENGGCNAIAVPHISKETGNGSQLTIYSNGDGTYDLNITSIEKNEAVEDFVFSFDRLNSVTVFNGDEEITIEVNIEWEKFVNILRFVGAAASGITECDWECYSGNCSNSGKSASNSAAPINVTRNKTTAITNRFNRANGKQSVNDVDDGESDTSDIDVSDDNEDEGVVLEVPVTTKKTVTKRSAPVVEDTSKKTVKKVPPKKYDNIADVMNDIDDDE